MLSVCMDAKIDQALPPEKEAMGTLYQVFRDMPLLYGWGGIVT